MHKKYRFMTSLIMLIGISAGMIMGYGMFAFVLCYNQVYPNPDLTVGFWIGHSLFTFVLPTIIPFTNAKRWFTVVILDEKGITQKFIGLIKIREITWEELSEIRLCTYMGGWIFFSKRPINNLFYDDIVKRKDVIQIGYSQKLEAAIKEYTDKEIVE